MPTVTHLACEYIYKVHKLSEVHPHVPPYLMYPAEAVPLKECMYLVSTRMPGESYCGRLRTCSCVNVTSFEHLLTPLPFYFCTGALGQGPFQIVTV